MPNIDMTKVIKLAEDDEFWSIRGKAIQSYANLEQALLQLFAGLTSVPRDAAAIILFKITSADARNKIIEKLFKRKFGAQYNPFRNSLLDQLRPIDIERNEVVHWNTQCSMRWDGTKEVHKLALVPPTFAFGNNQQQKGTEDLIAFDRKCEFYARLINMFTMMELETTKIPIPEADKIPWRAIFAQPIAYPPPLDHPLFPKPEALENHIQAFVVTD